MGQWYWQHLVDSNHDMLLSTINAIIGVHVPKAINFYVKRFNKFMANETEMSFISTVLGEKFPLSLFQTKYPQLRSSDQIIELHIDGRFLDVSTGDFGVIQNTIW